MDAAIAVAANLPHGRETGWCNKENGDYYVIDECAKEFTSSLDAALTLLEPKNDWRRLTPKSMSVYAASPYNAASQVRYDGYGATPALQLCSAFFKMLAAREAKASAIEARRAATENTGAVHESAAPSGETPR